MSAPVKKCEVCDSTGSKSREIGGDLDCVACNAADERVAMRNKLGPMMWAEEVYAWRAYQLGKAAASAPPDCSECDGRGFTYSGEGTPGNGFDVAPEPPEQDCCQSCGGSGKEAAAAPVVPVAAQPAWKALSDVQWMNIVNHDHAYDQYSKEDAVHTAVKMTEAKCKELNAGPHAAQPVVQQEPIGTLARNADESLTFTPLRDFHVRDGMFLFAAPSLEAQPAGEVGQLEQVREAVLLYFDALTARQHGGVAQDKAFSKIQDALGLYWQFGVDHRAMAQGEKQ